MIFGIEVNMTCIEEVLTQFKLVFHSTIYVKAQVKNFDFKAASCLQVSAQLLLHV